MVVLRLRTLLGSLIVLILAFFIINRFLYSALGFVETGASLVLYPLVKTQHVVATQLQKMLTKRKKNSELKMLIFDLQEKNSTLLAENVALQATAEYHEATQELIKFKAQYTVESPAILTQIIMKQFSDHEHFFLVDCGSSHGITVDMVAVYKNCLVGRVTHVYPLHSRVSLITDVGCKVAAYCRASKSRGILEGRNDKDHTLLQFVSHLHQLKEQDFVISSGEGLIFPQGFGLGRIDSYSLDGLQYIINVKPLLNFDELAYCYLIKKGQQ